MSAEDGGEPDQIIHHTFVIGLCPDVECGKPTIVYEIAESCEDVWDSWSSLKVAVVYPAGSGRVASSDQIPTDLRKLFAEAGRIESLSANGAAYLGRRILERVLRSELKSQARLAQLIDKCLEVKTLPPELHQLMHDVRYFGNIAGHPGESDTDEVLDVEPQEATYVLDVVEELLDYVYVRPHRQQEMRNRYQAKNEGRTPPPLGDREISIIREEPTEPVEQPRENDDDLPF